MALIKCPECSKKVSTKATVCVHCGCPLESPKVAIEKKKKPSRLAKFAKRFLVFSVAFLLMIIILAVSLPEPSAETKLDSYITKYSLSADCKKIIMQYLPEFESFSRMEQSGTHGYNIIMKDGTLYYLVLQMGTNEPVCLMSSEKDYDSRTRYYDKYSKE